VPTQASQERQQLRRQGMRGYAVCIGHSWTGALFSRLSRAERAAVSTKDAQVLLVRTDGKLYLQSQGRAIAPLVDPSDPSRIAGIDLRRNRRAAARATSTPQRRMSR
jgi:hypothetical protein